MEEQQKLWRVSDLLELSSSQRSLKATEAYESLITSGEIAPHIEESLLKLPDSASLGKNKYRRHWVGTTHAIRILSCAYPASELAALTLGAAIATQLVESRGIKLI